MKKLNRKSTKPNITPPLDTFAGIKLQPMTKQREVVAAEMGLKFGFVTPYRPQYYLRDTIIVLWLRTIKPDESKAAGWSVDRAEVEPELAMKEALKWAAKMLIGVDSPRFIEGWKIFVATMKAIREATGVPIIPEEDKSESPPDAGEL